MNKLSLINLPLDALHNIIEFFDRDEWPIFKNINIPLGTLNFDMLHNYEPVDIYVLPNGRLSKEPNPKDLFKRFIVSSDTINFLVKWKDIVSIILINSTDLRFDTISKNIIFEEFIKKEINIDDVNRPPDDDEFSESDFDDFNENQMSSRIYYSKITVPYLPNLKRIYMGHNNGYLLNFEKINPNVPIYWLDSGLYWKDASVLDFNDE